MYKKIISFIFLSIKIISVCIVNFNRLSELLLDIYIFITKKKEKQTHSISKVQNSPFYSLSSSLLDWSLEPSDSSDEEITRFFAFSFFVTNVRFF